MEYEKKYKDALEKARQLCLYPTTKPFINDLQNLFPELRESEDERIRKEIIATIHLYYGEPLEDEAKEMIAWLEKQGEKKHINDTDEDIVKAVKDTSILDMVEPKFHKGDWVVQENIGVYKVVEVCESWYEVIDNKDNHYSISFDKEYMCHLWTIQDAKDGDVLVCPLPKGCESGGQIFIFKKINSRDYVENCIEYYCRVCEGVFYVNKNGYMGTTSSPLYPATKEQRNLLFQKIKDAGYKWDEGKKELRKIEQKPQRIISAEAKEAMYDKPTDNDMVEALRTEYEKGRADVLRCIDPDEMVADFYSQPLSKTRSLASIYRQGIIDVLKRINKNEETNITNTRSIDDGGVQLPKS